MLIGPRAWGLHGQEWIEVAIDGIGVGVLFDPVAEEHRRRAEQGPWHELGWRELESLGALPLGVAIPRREVDAELSRGLMRLPEGCVAVSGETVRRIWRPPVQVRVVVGEARDGEAGLHAVSMFAAAGPRMLRLSRPPQDLGRLRERAARLGVGVYCETTGEPVAFSLPPSTRYVRDEAPGWLVAERAYAQWCMATVRSRPVGVGG